MRHRSSESEATHLTRFRRCVHKNDGHTSSGTRARRHKACAEAKACNGRLPLSVTHAITAFNRVNTGRRSRFGKIVRTEIITCVLTRWRADSEATRMNTPNSNTTNRIVLTTFRSARKMRTRSDSGNPAGYSANILSASVSLITPSGGLGMMHRNRAGKARFD